MAWQGISGAPPRRLSLTAIDPGVAGARRSSPRAATAFLGATKVLYAPTAVMGAATVRVDEGPKWMLRKGISLAASGWRDALRLRQRYRSWP